MKIGRYAQLRMLFASAVAMTILGSSVRAQTAEKQTALTGVVSDALCGAHHSMKGMSAADCTHMCVKAGQSYALVVGNKVYNLSGPFSRTLQVCWAEGRGDWRAQRR